MLVTTFIRDYYYLRDYILDLRKVIHPGVRHEYK